MYVLGESTRKVTRISMRLSARPFPAVPVVSGKPLMALLGTDRVLGCTCNGFCCLTHSTSFSSQGRVNQKI